MTRSRRPASVSAGLAVRPGRGSAPSPYARSVLDVVERIPRGQVLTYGDVAEWLGSGTGRTVGAVLSRYGREVAWWRVVQASGRPAEPHLPEATRRLVGEGCPMSADRVRLDLARWDGRDHLP